MCVCAFVCSGCVYPAQSTQTCSAVGLGILKASRSDFQTAEEAEKSHLKKKTLQVDEKVK